jgi:hypothetical protein
MNFQDHDEMWDETGELINLPAEDLDPIVARLREWEAPQPDPAATTRLIAALTPHLPPTRWQRLVRLWPVQLLLAQIHVVGREIGIASALIMGLGVAVTLAIPQATFALADLPFAVLAPIAAAVGVAFLYGPEPALEIEQVLPISYRLVLLTRLLLIFSFNLILGLGASIALSVISRDAGREIGVWALVGTWLAPMTFLSALAFGISTLSVDPLIGMAVSLALWGANIFGRVIPPLAFFSVLLSPANRVPMALLSIAVVGVALWVAGNDEHWLRERS